MSLQKHEKGGLMYHASLGLPHWTFLSDHSSGSDLLRASSSGFRILHYKNLPTAFEQVQHLLI